MSRESGIKNAEKSLTASKLPKEGEFDLLATELTLLSWRSDKNVRDSKVSGRFVCLVGSGRGCPRDKKKDLVNSKCFQQKLGFFHCRNCQKDSKRAKDTLARLNCSYIYISSAEEQTNGFVTYSFTTDKN